MAKEIINQKFSTPRDGIRTANIDIDVSSGNLSVGSLSAGDSSLASGMMQYLQGQDQPTVSLSGNSGHANLVLKASNMRQRWIRMPWAACNGATNWTVNICPEIPTDIHAFSGGGNIQLSLEGMIVQDVSAETGGGNVDLLLPSNGKDIQILAKSGGGNVTVKFGQNATGQSILEVGSGAGNVTASIPDDIPALIHAASGLGKVIIDTRFEKIGEKEYKSPGYEKAPSRIELTIQSGAGNVEVN
jgi:hypothetical protein